MKILLATFFMVPHLGGIWNYMQQLKIRLESLGHEVDLLGYGEGNHFVHIVNEQRQIEMNQLKSFLYPVLDQQTNAIIHKDPLIKHYEFLRYYYELGATYLGLEKYDLIHTQDVLSTACMNRIRPNHSALVASLHGSVAHELKQHVNNVLKTPTAKQACAYIDKLEFDGASSGECTIVANNWLKNMLINEFLVSPEQIKVLHYGYDIEGFAKKLKESPPVKRPVNKKIITYTGRLTEIKGVHHLVGALAQLKQIRNDWVCWIVGDGDKKEELQMQSIALGLENNVFFLGRRDDIPALLESSDIFVAPSLLENQPLSVIEAQIAGKAVIVSDSGGLPEMVNHESTGIISPSGDESLLCFNLNRLLEDRQLRETLGTNAQSWGLSYWSLDNAIQSILNVYQNALSKKQLSL
ncbi:glycosyltransferase family 4 protein [Mesobacillus maritimus]|uniref:glycosyltransferase family 4 protein n=1 Tax=Mesobacillus maritimus TaxID=1643336 RepID=UPI00384FB455